MMHLQFTFRHRLLAKQVWYRMYETIHWPGRMTPAELNKKYNKAIECGEVSLKTSPRRWWDRWKPLMKHLKPQVPSWHQGDCEAMIEKHGEQTFKGLDLWGVV